MFRVFRVLRVLGLEMFRVLGLGFRVFGLEVFRVFRVLGFRV